MQNYKKNARTRRNDERPCPVREKFEIEESLFQAMFTDGLLEKLNEVVSEERIREELQKMFQHIYFESLSYSCIFFRFKLVLSF